MNTLIIGTCPWIKTPFGQLTNNIAYTASEISTVLVLGENHDASIFGDGNKSSITNDGHNEIEVWNLPNDPHKAATFISEIQKAWNFDIVITIGSMLKFEWLKAFYEFSNHDSRWVAVIPENADYLDEENYVDHIVTVNNKFNSDIEYTILDYRSLWDGCFSIEEDKNYPNEEVGIVGENMVISNFHLCNQLKDKYKFNYFNYTSPRSYFSDTQLESMGIKPYDGFRTLNFWDNEDNWIDFINHNSLFIILDDTPDFGYYEYCFGLSNKIILTSSDRIKANNNHLFLDSIKLPSNNEYIKHYNVMFKYDQVEEFMQENKNISIIYRIKKGNSLIKIKEVKEIIIKYFNNKKRINEIKLELIK